jgi:hypothetical protein
MSTELLTFGEYEGYSFQLQIRHTSSVIEATQTVLFSEMECLLVVIRNNVLHLLYT